MYSTLIPRSPFYVSVCVVRQNASSRVAVGSVACIGAASGPRPCTSFTCSYLHFVLLFFSLCVCVCVCVLCYRRSRRPRPGLGARREHRRRRLPGLCALLQDVHELREQPR